MCNLMRLVASSSAPRNNSNTTVILRRADHRPFSPPTACGAAPVALRAPFAPPPAPFPRSFLMDIALPSPPVASPIVSQTTVQRNRGAGESLSEHSPRHCLHPVNGVHRPVTMLTCKLSDEPIQMLPPHLVMAAIELPLEQSTKAIDTVRVNLTPHILADRVLDGPVIRQSMVGPMIVKCIPWPQSVPADGLRHAESLGRFVQP